jgi:hypothetical protein
LLPFDLSKGVPLVYPVANKVADSLQPTSVIDLFLESLELFASAHRRLTFKESLVLSFRSRSALFFLKAKVFSLAGCCRSAFSVSALNTRRLFGFLSSVKNEVSEPTFVGFTLH